MFAPTWDLVNMYKAGEIGPTEYTGIYLKLMQKSYQENRKEWTDIKDHPKIVLTCYCRSGVFCHRVLLAKFMEDVCKIGTYKGEL